MRSRLQAKRRRPTRETYQMKQMDDMTLMLAVARKDNSAFERLYKKFVGASYNLASYIIGSGLEADDVVQDAFQSIWVTGSSFDPTKASTVRSWVLRIVANKALLTLRARRKIKEINDEDLSRTAINCREPEQELLQAELAEALRSNLKRLPDNNRHCIALYFGAQLSQQEIADKLGLPPRTVSYNIQNALRELRQALSSPGLAVASPQVLSTQIQHAICFGRPIPDSLENWSPNYHSAQVHASPERIESQLLSRTPVYLGIGIAIIVCSIAGIKIFPMQNKSDSKSQEQLSGLNESLEEPVQKDTSDQTKRKKIHKKWTFANSTPKKDLAILHGGWEFKANGKRGGAMKNAQGTLVIQFLLPLRPPLKLTVQGTNVETGGQTALAAQFTHNPQSTANVWGIFRNASRAGKLPTVFNYTYYISAEFIDSWSKQKRTGTTFIQQSSTQPLTLTVRGLISISRIEVEEIEEEILPDLTIFRTAINRIPVEKRVGSVIVPEIRSVHPILPVRIEFSKFVFEEIPFLPEKD